MIDPKLKIYFFSPFCIKRNTTNRIFDMRMCDAIVGHGVPVTVVYSYLYMKENQPEKELFRAYGLDHTFNLRMQYTPLHEKTPSSLRFIVQLISFFISTLRIMLENVGRLNHTVIITREVAVAFPPLFIKKILGPLAPFKVIPHLDEVKNYKMKRWAYRHVNGILPVVSSVKQILMKEEGISEEKFCVMYAPVINFSKTDCSKEEARKKIKYDSSVPLIVYTGKIGRGNVELEYILETAKLLPQYNFMFTGGRDASVKYFREWCEKNQLGNTTFTGFFDNVSQVRYYQLAADVLVSYYNTKDHMVDFNYPQKLQEYISTKNPCVTPDFAATRDVITSENVFFVEPDNPIALAEGIKDAVQNKELAKKKAAAAFEASKKVTFESRTTEFLEFFSRLK